MIPEPPRRHSAPLIATALFAMVWVTLRAWTQSITIDEADTYLAFVAPSFPSHWLAFANNHVLNSMLMRLFTSLAGTSHLTVRAPALLGAALYICAAYGLVRLIARERLLEWALFVCLVYNPFVQDYLVAARGYSLALAFLMAAVWAAARQPVSRRATCAIASISLALSFAANFSFGLVDAAALLLILLWTGRRDAWLLAAGTLPGLVVAVFLTGPVVLSWPHSEFRWGAASLGEMSLSVIKATLYEVNPYLVNPPLYHFLSHWRRLLLPALALVCLWRLAVVVFRREATGDERAQWLARLGALAAGAAAIAVFAHWTAFRLAHVPLPLDRTAVYLAPLLTLAVGVIAAMPSPSRMGTVSRRALGAGLLVTAVYFLLCLRLTYFKEWKYDADSRTIYSVLTYYHRTYAVGGFASNWRYSSALNFYRAAAGDWSVVISKPDSTETATYPSGKSVYVLSFPTDEGFAEALGLKVVYRGATSGAVVAIRPEIERARPCSP